MTKIVYNACYGGFGLSYKAVMRYAELKGIKLWASTRNAGDFETVIPYDGTGKKPWIIHYRTTEDPSVKDNYFSERDIPRNDTALVQVVEELGEDANGDCAYLEIEDIPEGTLYRIDEYDGRESVCTMSDYDWQKA